MTNEDRFFDLIALNEGRTLDLDPTDPGNWTGGAIGVGYLRGSKMGISAASFPTLDIRNLTMPQITMIYRHYYLNAINFSALPNGTALMLAECAVNQGVTEATILLQETVGVPVDGIFGPITLGAAQRGNDNAMTQRLAVLRALRYTVTRGLPSFGNSWFTRLFRTFNVAITPLGAPQVKRIILLSSVTLAAMTGAAVAQTAPSTTGVDVVPWFTWATPTAVVIGSTLMSLVTGWLAIHVRNALVRMFIMQLLTAAGHGVYQILVAEGSKVTDVENVNTAVAVKVKDVLDLIKPYIKVLGLTPTSLADFVSKEIRNAFGKALATDPAVTIAAPPDATTNAPGTVPSGIVSDGKGGVMFNNPALPQS